MKDKKSPRRSPLSYLVTILLTSFILIELTVILGLSNTSLMQRVIYEPILLLIKGEKKDHANRAIPEQSARVPERSAITNSYSVTERLDTASGIRSENEYAEPKFDETKEAFMSAD
jgi:hypothetical protein